MSTHKGFDYEDQPCLADPDYRGLPPVHVTCLMCARKSYFNGDKVREWRHGKLIQEAFPDRSADDRELLKSNICGQCLWGMIGEEE